MPGAFSEAILQETMDLYMQLLRKSVKDKYRGHQDYHLILNSIDPDTPIVGGKITVQKEDRNGNFYTVTYNVTVKDDLGNFIQSIDDLGGQCMKGEIVKKGYVFTCLECGEPFCRRHVKFVDKSYKKPLCRYGFMGYEGCYARYWKEYTDSGITRIKTETERLETISQYEIAKKKLDAIQRGQFIGDDSGGRILLPRKKTGLLGRALHGSVQSIRCGYCNESVSLAGVRCPNCQNFVDIDVDSSNCPNCREPIREVNCPRCGATNKL